MITPFELHNYSEQEIFEKIILKIFKQFPEAKWLAADKVAITRESQSGNPGPGWTSKLVESSLIDKPQTNNGEINKYIELERMLSSVVFFHLFYDGSDAAYDKLVSVQNANEKLSKENFKKLHQLMRSVAKSDEAYNSMIAMLVYSDLGKAPQARNKAEIQVKDINKSYADHDDFIDAVLNLNSHLIPQIIPSYFSLPLTAKNILAKVASTMKVHLGHALHIEGGEKMFRKLIEAINLNKVSPDILDFAFAIQIADVAASAGQVTNQGSLSLNDVTCQGYLLVKATLLEIIAKRSAKIALEHYLDKRGEWLQLDTNPKENAILVRLGCMLRYYNATDGQCLIDYSKKLSDKDWELLNKQFGLDTGFNNWKRNPTYLPALLLNIVKCKGNPLEAAVCVAQLLEQYESTGLHNTSDNPLCFNLLAGIAAREPQLLTFEKFSVEQFMFNEENNVVKKESKTLELNI